MKSGIQRVVGPYAGAILVGLCLVLGLVGAYMTYGRESYGTQPSNASPLMRPFSPLPQTFTLLLAGRDVIYCGYHDPCKNQEQRVGVQQTSQTDSIMLIKVDGQQVHVLNIPRDTNVGPFEPGKSAAEQKVNSRYWVGGPQELSKAVTELTGDPIDHYMIVRTDFVARVIDALGGLDVDVPVPGIAWIDHAAGIDFKLSAGPHHLNGADAVLFLRVRKGFGDDYGRIDHQKQAVTELFERLKTPQGWLAVPTILSGFKDGIETDISTSALPALLPRLKQPRLTFATLPTLPIPHSFNLAVDREALAKIWDTPDTVVVPALQKHETPILIFDATGTASGEKLAEQLHTQGYRHVRVRLEPISPQPSQVFTINNFPVAQALSHTLHLPCLQGERFSVQSNQVGILLGAQPVESPRKSTAG